MAGQPFVELEKDTLVAAHSRAKAQLAMALTSVRQAEVTAQRRMLDRTQERFGIWPERLAADTGYGDAANLAWLVHERGIEPHIPVFEKSRTDGSFGRTDFTYDHETDSYTCPGVYSVKLTVTDDRGGKGTKTSAAKTLKEKRAAKADKKSKKRTTS